MYIIIIHGKTVQWESRKQYCSTIIVCERVYHVSDIKDKLFQCMLLYVWLVVCEGSTPSISAMTEYMMQKHRCCMVRSAMFDKVGAIRVLIVSV